MMCLMARYSISREVICSIIATLLILLLQSGCGGGERFKATTSLERFQGITQQSEETQKSTNNLVQMTNASPQGAGDYLLGGGDLLDIKVFETEDLHTEVRVSSRGEINVPLLGNIDVLNKTAAEVEQQIEDLYREKYLHDPHVTVYIKEHMSKQITLVGAVTNPGTYEYVSSRKLLDVLAVGMGLKENAGSLAFITRHNPKTQENYNYVVDLDDLVKNGNMALNHAILAGDVIFVPESGQCFVDGAVRKPGTYMLESNMNITQAIAAAGGLAGYADKDAIKLIRFMGKGQKRQIISLSYSDLQAGIGDTLILKDQDIIYAESSSGGKFLSGTGFTIGFLGTGIRYNNPEQ